MGALDKIQRGFDTSGRPVYGTRQNFQFYDRVNARVGGQLVIVQGSWSNANASAGTHLLAMCMDYRTWNLTTAQRLAACRYGRDLMGTMYYRSPLDGFDPHIHNNLIGDAPAHWMALDQVEQYKAGLNGLDNRAVDRDPYRPRVIGNYKYLDPEDDMNADQERLLKETRDLAQRTLTRVNVFAENEKQRWANERERDKRAKSDMFSLLGGQADTLARIESKVEDRATKQLVRKQRERIMKYLKDNPDVEGVDNPSDDAMAEENFG